MRPDLEPLPENPNGRSNIDPGAVGAFDFSCPKDAPVRTFDVVAVNALTALQNSTLIYNSRYDGGYDPLSDPTALIDKVSELALAPGSAIDRVVLVLGAREVGELTAACHVGANLVPVQADEPPPAVPHTPASEPHLGAPHPSPSLDVALLQLCQQVGLGLDQPRPKGPVGVVHGSSLTLARPHDVISLTAQSPALRKPGELVSRGP